jgi:hypothetical protein
MFQGAAKDAKDGHRFVQTFPFLSFVSGGVEQFSRTCPEHGFRFNDALREFGQVRLKNHGVIYVSP